MPGWAELLQQRRKEPEPAPEASSYGIPPCRTSKSFRAFTMRESYHLPASTETHNRTSQKCRALAVNEDYNTAVGTENHNRNQHQKPSAGRKPAGARGRAQAKRPKPKATSDPWGGLADAFDGSDQEGEEEEAGDKAASADPWGGIMDAFEEDASSDEEEEAEATLQSGVAQAWAGDLPVQVEATQAVGDAVDLVRNAVAALEENPHPEDHGIVDHNALSSEADPSAPAAWRPPVRALESSSAFPAPWADGAAEPGGGPARQPSRPGGTPSSKRWSLRLELSKSCPDWTQQQIQAFMKVLASIGINSTATLAEAVAKNLNQQLRDASMDPVSDDTLAGLRGRLWEEPVAAAPGPRGATPEDIPEAPREEAPAPTPPASGSTSRPSPGAEGEPARRDVPGALMEQWVKVPELARATGLAMGVLMACRVAALSRAHCDWICAVFPEIYATLPACIYVLGGHSGGSQRAAETALSRFAPDADCWEALPGMPTPRTYCTAAASRGKIYVVGGFDGSRHLDSCECFDVVSGRWERLPPMSAPRCGCGAVVVRDRLHVVGGAAGRSEPHDSHERFDPATRRWEAFAPSSLGRGTSFAVAAVQERIYVVGFLNGESRFERLDPSVGGPWEGLPPLKPALFKNEITAAAAVGDRLYVCSASILALRVFDTRRGAWESPPATSGLPDRVGAGRPTCAASAAGHLYIVGAWDADGEEESTVGAVRFKDMYNSKAGNQRAKAASPWCMLPPFPSHAGCAVVASRC